MANLTKVYKIAELLLLFIFLPVLFKYDVIPGHKIIPLMIVFVYALVIVLTDKSFDRKLLGINGFRNWKLIFTRFIFIAFISTVLVYISEPGILFYLPRRNLLLWILIMIFYPLWSVYPQEFIYRTFFFYRYRFITNNNTLFIIINAAAFSFVHIIFNNFIAIALSFGAGLIFALTYHRFKSLLVVSIEHSMYGDLIFTNGIGKYFYVRDF